MLNTRSFITPSLRLLVLPPPSSLLPPPFPFLLLSLSLSLLISFFLHVAFLRKRTIWIHARSTYSYLGRALIDPKLPPRSFATRNSSSFHRLYLPGSICLVYFISLSVLLSFSLAVILVVMLRLPTRVSRALSRECARETKRRRSASHYQNSNVLLFSILQIESKYKIASSSINNLYRKNTKG